MSIFGAVAFGAAETVAAGTAIGGVTAINRMVKCRTCGRKVRNIAQHMRTVHGRKGRSQRKSRRDGWGF